jgi:hypothetical protein
MPAELLSGILGLRHYGIIMGNNERAFDIQEIRANLPCVPVRGVSVATVEIFEPITRISVFVDEMGNFTCNSFNEQSAMNAIELVASQIQYELAIRFRVVRVL